MVRITLKSEGQSWEGVKSFKVEKSMDSVVHRFDINTTDRRGQGFENWNIEGGSEVDILLNDDAIFSGFAQKYTVSILDKKEITVSGFSKAIDIVECSHLGLYFWKNIPAEDIISEVLKPFGLEAKISKPLLRIPNEGFKVSPSDSAFNIIRRIAERDGLLIFTNNEGLIVLSDGSDSEGRSLLTTGDYTGLTINHDISRAHSELIIKAQQTTYVKDFGKKQQIQKRAKNSAITRYRPLIIINNDEEDVQEVFANYANKRFAGDSVVGQITLKSPYDKEGKLWGINQSVWLRDEHVNVDQELLISKVVFAFTEDDGFTCTLDLRTPETYRLTFDQGIVSVRSSRRSTGVMGEVKKALQ